MHLSSVTKHVFTQDNEFEKKLKKCPVQNKPQIKYTFFFCEKNNEKYRGNNFGVVTVFEAFKLAVAKKKHRKV